MLSTGHDWRAFDPVYACQYTQYAQYVIVLYYVLIVNSAFIDV
jgi:hypothetical protein